MENDNGINFVVTVDKHNDGSYFIRVPDLNIIAYGKDYTVAVHTTISTVEAIYYYNQERGIEIEFKTTYAAAEAMCKKDTQFVTYLAIAK